MLEAQKPVFSPNGASAIIVQPVQPGDGSGDAFQDAVQSIRDRIGEPDDGLEVKLTGAAGFSLDAIKVFSGINGTLLYAAAAIVLILLDHHLPVADLLGDPVLHASLLAEGASRGAGYLLAEAGVTINGQTGGILPVLVFGAGTDYALLLVSRYREELRRHEDKHEATAIALRSAGPGDPRLRADGDRRAADAEHRRGQLDRRARAGRGDGRRAGDDLDADRAPRAAGDLRAAARSGRRAWTRSPTPGRRAPTRRTASGGGVGDRVARRPRTIWIIGSIVLLILAANVLNLDTSQTTGNQFRGEVDSVQGQEVLSRNFPAGASAPADVIVGDASKAEAVTAALKQESDLVSDVRPGGSRATPACSSRSPSRATRTRPSTMDTIPRLREVAEQAGGAGHARRRPDRAGVRPARVRHPRQQADHPADAARRVRDPDRAAALARRAACC